MLCMQTTVQGVRAFLEAQTASVQIGPIRGGLFKRAGMRLIYLRKNSQMSGCFTKRFWHCTCFCNWRKVWPYGLLVLFRHSGWQRVSCLLLSYARCCPAQNLWECDVLRKLHIGFASAA